MWPEFALELEAASEISVGYRDEGTIVVALTRDDAEQLRFTYEFQRSLGLDLEWLSGAEARRREPHLRPGIAGAVFSREIIRSTTAGSPGPRQGGAWRRGHAARARCRGREVDISAGRVAAVVSEHGHTMPEIVVFAAGAWSRDIGGIPAEYLPPVRPIKGQMLALRMEPERPRLSHVVWLPRGYLVPRHDGRTDRRRDGRGARLRR